MQHTVTVVTVTILLLIMQFLLLSAVCIAIFRPMKCTLATDAPGNSSVANHELAEIKEQVQVLGGETSLFVCITCGMTDCF